MYKEENIKIIINQDNHNYDFIERSEKNKKRIFSIINDIIDILNIKYSEGILINEKNSYFIFMFLISDLIKNDMLVLE